MVAELHSEIQTRSKDVRPGIARRFLLLFPALLIIAVMACGTDDGNADSVAAQQFEINGDTLTWAPPWEAGDIRIVSLSTSVDYSAAIQEQIDMLPEFGGELPDLTEPQASTVGTITIVSTGGSGTKAEFAIALEEMISQFETQMAGQTEELEDSGFGQFSAMLSLVNQLDLDVEFGIDNSGALTGVTNMDELAANIQQFINSILRLASFGGEEPISPEDQAKLTTFLSAFPETETAQFLSQALLNQMSGNLFLMRSGQYTLGQPVSVAGIVPTAFGFETPGHATYELTDISNGAATVKVEVSPGTVDVLALLEEFAVEIAPLVDGDGSEFSQDIAELEPDEGGIFDSLSSILFEPYTVTLTIDAATGWVTASEWDMALQLPDGFADLIPPDEQDLGGLSVSDIGMTFHVSATFE